MIYKDSDVTIMGVMAGPFLLVVGMIMSGRRYRIGRHRIPAPPNRSLTRAVSLALRTVLGGHMLRGPGRAPTRHSAEAAMTVPDHEHHLAGGVDSHDRSADYLKKRQLKSGSAGWLLLAGLGVSYVISGDYSGWNFGLAEGGFGGLAIAAIVIAAMYLALVLGMAELSSSLPAAGGGCTFARRALGPWGGFATGTAILIEYSIAPAAIATFIGAYVESLDLFGITDGWWVYLVAYAIFIGIHPRWRG